MPNFEDLDFKVRPSLIGYRWLFVIVIQDSGFAMLKTSVSDRRWKMDDVNHPRKKTNKVTDLETQLLEIRPTNVKTIPKLLFTLAYQTPFETDISNVFGWPYPPLPFPPTHLPTSSNEAMTTIVGRKNWTAQQGGSWHTRCVLRVHRVDKGPL